MRCVFVEGKIVPVLCGDTAPHKKKKKHRRKNVLGGRFFRRYFFTTCIYVHTFDHISRRTCKVRCGHKIYFRTSIGENKLSGPRATFLFLNTRRKIIRKEKNSKRQNDGAEALPAAGTHFQIFHCTRQSALDGAVPYDDELFRCGMHFPQTAGGRRSLTAFDHRSGFQLAVVPLQ